MTLEQIDRRIHEALYVKKEAAKYLQSSLTSNTPLQTVKCRAQSAGAYRQSRRDFAVESLVNSKKLYSYYLNIRNRHKYGRVSQTAEEPNYVIYEKRELVRRMEEMIADRTRQIAALQRTIRDKQVQLHYLSREYSK